MVPGAAITASGCMGSAKMLKETNSVVTVECEQSLGRQATCRSTPRQLPALHVRSPVRLGTMTCVSRNEHVPSFPKVLLRTVWLWSTPLKASPFIVRPFSVTVPTFCVGRLLPGQVGAGSREPNSVTVPLRKANSGAQGPKVVVPHCAGTRARFANAGARPAYAAVTRATDAKPISNVRT